MVRKYTSLKYGFNFVKGLYLNSSCTLDGEITLEDLKPLIGKSKIFEVQDWFGGCEKVKFTIQNVVETQHHFEFYVKSSSHVPERMCPTIYEIVKDLNIIAPISLRVER